MHLLLCALDANCRLLDSLELANHSKSRTNGDYALDGSGTYLNIVLHLGRVHYAQIDLQNCSNQVLKAGGLGEERICKHCKKDFSRHDAEGTGYDSKG